MMKKQFKKYLAFLICSILISCVVLAGSLPVTAADKIRIIDYAVQDLPSAEEPSQYILLFLDVEVNNARHCQTTERVYEPDMPEDSWNFPDSLVDATRKYILVNGTSLGDYIDAAGSPFGAVVCYEKNEAFNGRQTLILGLHSEAIPGTNPKTDDYTVEIKAGFFGSTDGWKNLTKFEATTLKWDHKAKKLTILRKDDGGLTLDEIKAGKTPEKKNSSGGTSSVSSSNSSSTTIGKKTTTSQAAQGDTTEEIIEEVVEEVVAKNDSPLVASDIVSQSDKIHVNFIKSEVQVEDSMTVKDLMSKLVTNPDYKTGVYNGRREIPEDEPLYAGYRLKVFKGEEQIGSLYIDVPDPKVSNDMSPLVWIIPVCAGVVVLAVVALILVILLTKKKSKEN